MATNQTVLILNSGSSSIKFGLYTKDEPPRPHLSGKIERMGLPQTAFQWQEPVAGRTGDENMEAQMGAGQRLKRESRDHVIADILMEIQGRET
jgi:acetate kinase